MTEWTPIDRTRHYIWAPKKKPGEATGYFFGTRYNPDRWVREAWRPQHAMSHWFIVHPDDEIIVYCARSRDALTNIADPHSRMKWDDPPEGRENSPHNTRWATHVKPGAVVWVPGEEAKACDEIRTAIIAGVLRLIDDRLASHEAKLARGARYDPALLSGEQQREVAARLVAGEKRHSTLAARELATARLYWQQELPRLFTVAGDDFKKTVALGNDLLGGDFPKEGSWNISNFFRPMYNPSWLRSERQPEYRRQEEAEHEASRHHAWVHMPDGARKRLAKRDHRLRH